MTGKIAVAISTTGDEHRLKFLETCVRKWNEALPPGALLFVTVDGSTYQTARAAETVNDITGSVFRVGQGENVRDGRMGVAVNKNTGLELMIDNTDAEHLFLCDDDTWPLGNQAFGQHVALFEECGIFHSMVCWGSHRLEGPVGPIAMWSWPRGVVMYTHRSAVSLAGGMDERFGPGGHEHVEWSRRMHQWGLTPKPFVTPRTHAELNGMGARMFWHAEDMPRRGEARHTFHARKDANTSVKRLDGDWDMINAVMDERDGDTSFVPFRASDNGRSSATMWSHDHVSCAEEPETE